MTSRRIAFATAIASFALIMAAHPARAQDDRSGPTPPRLGFVDGDVSFWRPGAEDWVPAQVNTPLAEGDEIYAADRANVELQISSRAFIRAGGDAQIGLETLDDQTMQYKVTNGHAAFDLQRLPPRQTIEIDTPRAAITIDRPGYYRVDVDEQRPAFSARRGGAARVVAVNGDVTNVAGDQQLVLGDAQAGAAVQPVADYDDWDRWNLDRTSSLGEAPRSAQYVSPEVAGVDDLDRYGDWHDEPQYGRVWRPREVAPDWAPYSAGRWVYDPYYEWTWVDDAPWGWGPYHYGRWVNTSGYWGWAPGPVVVSPAYAPALVAFFGAPGIGVSVSVGAPFVSWCALGFGEPVVPWWGGPRYVGRPYWGGWGGPRIVNNVVINNTRIVNVDNITHYQNVGVRNAVFGVDRERFRRGGRPGRVGEARDLRPMRHMDVRPAAQSFMPHDGHGRRPPENVQRRTTVALRQPRDPVPHLRAKGAQIATPPTARTQTRIVRPHGAANPQMAGTRPDATPGATAFGRGDGLMHRGRDDQRPLGRGGMAGPSTAPAPPRHGGVAAAPTRPTPPGARARAERSGGAAPPPPASAARPRELRHGNAAATPPAPPRTRVATPTPAPIPHEPSRSARRETGRDRAPSTSRPLAPPTPARPDQQRARREVQHAAPPPEHREPAPRERRVVEPSRPRDTVSAPMPRGGRARFEAPRNVPRERPERAQRAPNPIARAPRGEPRVERSARDTRARRHGGQHEGG